jgi:hypothetical protein
MKFWRPIGKRELSHHASVIVGGSYHLERVRELRPRSQGASTLPPLVELTIGGGSCPAGDGGGLGVQFRHEAGQDTQKCHHIKVVLFHINI